MRHAYWILLPLAYIGRKRFPVVVVAIGLFRLLRLPIGDEVGDPRVRAGGVIRRIAQVQDVLVAADGKAFDLAELRVGQKLAELFREIFAPFFIGGKCHSQACYRRVFGVQGLWSKV